MSVDYGNARVAALRSRLLDRPAMTRLAESATPGVFLSTLERAPDWTAIVRGVLPLGADPAMAADAAIERHRSARLGSLPRWYPGGSRALVEALVLPLDAQRVLALLRRRRAGEPVEAAVATVVPGALLDARTLGRIARATSAARALELLVDHGVLDTTDLGGGMRAEGASPAELEAALAGAFDRARLRRASGRGRDARRVRELLAREQEERAAVETALREQGPAAAALLDGSLALRRLVETAADGYRDPLGIGAVMGYVAAVEAQAIRLRAALARARGDWRPEQLAPYLSPTTVRRWHAWSS